MTKSLIRRLSMKSILSSFMGWFKRPRGKQSRKYKSELILGKQLSNQLKNLLTNPLRELLNKSSLTVADAYLHIPLLAAVLFDGHVQFLSRRLSSASDYCLLTLQLFFECLPFFIAHHLASRLFFKQAAMIWLIGFIVYPTLTLVWSAQLEGYNQWHLLSIQSWVLAAAASSVGLLQRKVARKKRFFSRSWLNRLLSLNGLIIAGLIGWAISTAGVLNSHVDPMLNQPFNYVIDIAKIFTQFSNFLSYLWQLLFLGGLLLLFFLFNRYVLIRKVLAKQGVISFISAVLIGLIVLTPVLAAVALQLPINDLPEHVDNFTPGGDSNLFNRYNYQFMFLLFALTTPVILIFERQKQDAELTEISQRQTKTELQLLQQQIQPHFLFNTLNNLYALTLKKSPKAPDLVMQLSELLSYTVYKGQMKYVPLAEEIAYMQNFIELQKIRSHERCRFDVHWPEDSTQTQIAPLLIIILLENAIKHGTALSACKSWVKLELHLQENQLSVLCENPFLPEAETLPKGVGLENLRRRLQLLYPDSHSLDIKAHAGIWRVNLKMVLHSC